MKYVLHIDLISYLHILLPKKKMGIEQSKQNKHNNNKCDETNNNKQIKFLDLVQINPDDFNKNQEERQKKYKNKHGQKALDKILWADKHHDLKASRSVDYRLTDVELEKLQTDQVLLKHPESHISFAKSYMSLYNNDMPCIVTSDSMLFAIHKFYDTYLKNLETNVLSNKLRTVCDSMLQSLYSITPTEQNLEYLTNLEVYFMIAKTLISLRTEIPEKITYEPNLLFSKDEIKALFVKPSRERINEENLLYPDSEQKYFDFHWDKPKQFIKFIYSDNEDTNGYYNYILSSPKLQATLAAFTIPCTPEPVVFKYSGEELFHKIIASIATESDIEMNMCGVNLKIMGSLFKPRGHYTESIQLKNYYRAFTWLSKFDITIRKGKDSLNGLILASILTKIAESHIDQIDEFQTFIGKIIGQGDSCSIKSFLELINKHIPQLSLDDSISFILTNSDQLLTNVMSENLKVSKLNKFGDYVNNDKSISFSLINKGNPIDNEVISKFVDGELVDDNGNCPQRKFPSIFDLILTLFGNSSVESHAKQNLPPGNYDNHLKQLKTKYDNYSFDDNTCYGQELKMMRALTADKINISPFNTEIWNKKQAIAQIGHYAELRRDNCLYVEEFCGIMCCCEYPDLMIEPVPTFWKEMLNLVLMMKSLLDGLDNWDLHILENFEIILNKFILVTDNYLSGKKTDPEIIDSLKTICFATGGGSGAPDFDGWYLSLFHKQEGALEVVPECGTWFTAPYDNRGPGGIETLGTNGTNLLYVVVDNKVFLGPTYNAYSFRTDYNDRLNDEEFATRIKEFTPLTL